MNSFPKTSLVTPTYNWPEALELLLLSIKKQSVLPDEVIIADDGSRKETKDLIDRFKEDFPIPIHHIWHEDIKNRKPMIMNKAIANANFEYIIEIDGDIIMHKDFVKDHLNYAENGCYLFGSRANIESSILSSIFKNKTINFNFFSKGIKKRSRTFRLPFYMNNIKKHNQRSAKLRGCNMSFWKSDFIKINGFNEDLVGWGIDDSEMIERMHNIGVLGKRLKQVALCYHIYHKEQSREGFYNVNEDIQKETILYKKQTIENGISQYL